jgi:2-C-methyl-D-erythritol 2,4-cyclodiphosphate synthase
VIGGVIFEGIVGLEHDSDGDVIVHAICNAISSLCGVPIMKGLARDLIAKDGITDSMVYLQKGLVYLYSNVIVHVALSVEAKKPPLAGKVDVICAKVAHVCGLHPSQVGMTTYGGSGLTDVGCGEGVSALCLMTIDG